MNGIPTCNQGSCFHSLGIPTQPSIITLAHVAKHHASAHTHTHTHTTDPNTQASRWLPKITFLSPGVPKSVPGIVATTFQIGRTCARPGQTGMPRRSNYRDAHYFKYMHKVACRKMLADVRCIRTWVYACVYVYMYVCLPSFTRITHTYVHKTMNIHTYTYTYMHPNLATRNNNTKEFRCHAVHKYTFTSTHDP